MAYRRSSNATWLMLIVLGTASCSALQADEPIGLTDGDWPQWRGQARDAVSPATNLLTNWPDDGPPLAWTATGLGNGQSSVIVAGGSVYTLGQRDGVESLIALDERDGHEIWSTRIGDGVPNSTPTFEGAFVYALGIKGDLVCASARSGKESWRLNILETFGGSVMSNMGYCESVLVDGERVICTPGANDAVLVALNKKSGSTIWKARLPEDAGPKGVDAAAYSSVVISEACGVRQYVQFVGRGVIGVEAESGNVLWTYNRVTTEHANVATPAVQGDYVFCSACYGGGSALIRIIRDGDKLRAEEVYYLEPKTLENHHGGMVIVGDYLYTGTGFSKGFPVCLQWKTGKQMWRPGRGPGLGSAAIMYADANLYFRYENGTTVLIAATPEEYIVRAKFDEPTNLGKAWSHPVIANARLYLRDQDVLNCYDVKRK